MGSMGRGGWLFALLLLSWGVLGAEPDSQQRPYDESLAGRTILVTIADPARQRPRLAAGAHPGAYARRGTYGSSTWSRREAGRIRTQYALEQLEAWPVTALGVECIVYLAPQGADVDALLARLRADPRIAVAQRMGYFGTGGASYDDPYLPLQSGVQGLDLPDLHRVATGRGVRVAIIDTGVDYRHVDLGGRLEYRQNLVSEVSPGFSGDRHGTAIAGIIGARADNAAGIAGLAPAARLLAFKACWPAAPDGEAARCNSLTLARAIDEALRRDAQVLNLSLHGPYDPLLAALIGKAVDDGVIVVVADSSAEGKEHDFPASVPDVLAVRSAVETSPGRVYAEAGGLYAPGRDVLTTLPENCYGFVSGASYAAAHVTGLVALRLELEPELSAAQLVPRLIDTASLERNRAGGEYASFDEESGTARLVR